MNNKFGFKLSPSSRIDMDSADRSLFEKILKEQPDIIQCIACGSCAASCTAGNYTKVNLRKVIVLLDRGCNKEAKDLLKGCMLCGKCSLVCPRGLNTRNIIFKINQLIKIELL